MSSKTPTNHAAVFSSLMILSLSAVGVALLHFSVPATNFSIFIVAAVMAGLVLFQYMNLKNEGALIYWVAIIPLVLFALLVFLLIPDVCHFSIDFLRGL